MHAADGIQYIASPLFPDKEVNHAFLSRIGGVSKPPFNSLNFDNRDTDTNENIEKNRDKLSKTLDVPVKNLVLVNQVHGSKVLVIKDSNPAGQPVVEADAIITNIAQVPIGIMTADCLPVLIYDPVKKAVAAVHAGWKGSAGGVSIEAINAMRLQYGSDPKDMVAALGPYIGPCCYSVRENVVDEFKNRFGSYTGYIQKFKDEIRLDIGLANIEQLTGSGIPKANISFEPVCTSCNNALFFSYRKDGGRTGRQLSYIMLKGA